MLDKKLFSMLGKDKKKIVHITILELLSNILNVFITMCICLICNLLILRINETKRYVIYFSLIIVFLILKLTILYFSGNMKNYLGNNAKTIIRSDIYQKLLKLGFSYKQSISSLTQLSIEGVEQIDVYFTNYLPNFFNALIAPICLFVITTIFNWKVGLVLIAFLPLIPISIILVSKWAKKIFAKYWDKYTSMGDVFFDSLQGMKELKIYNADQEKGVDIRRKSEDFRKITMKVLLMQLVSLTIIDTIAFTGAGTAIVLAVRETNSLFGINSAILALFLILISAEFFLPMRALASAFHVAMNGATSGKKIYEFLNEIEVKWGNEKLDKVIEVGISNLSFGYSEHNLVLKDINMNFKQGFNAIVGESGSGKSTIISLILAGLIPNSGEVLINSKSVRNYNRQSYYEKVCYVGYNTYIFNLSIRDNFKMVNENIEDEEIIELLQEVNLEHIAKFDKKLDHVILEDSENLSGGERQRLALAINLSIEKDVYIFDEATSNIDIDSENIIMGKIKSIAKKKIVIFISHRLFNVISADNIYLIKDGSIMASGNHHDMLKKCVLYEKMFNEQYYLENSYKEGLKNEKK